MIPDQVEGRAPVILRAQVRWLPHRAKVGTVWQADGLRLRVDSSILAAILPTARPEWGGAEPAVVSVGNCLGDLFELDTIGVAHRTGQGILFANTYCDLCFPKSADRWPR